MNLTKIHHVAIICSDYEKSKDFYVNILGLAVIAENYRKDRKSWKLDLALNGEYIIELFSFENPPKRHSYPEACGLRHLAFQTDNIYSLAKELECKNIQYQTIRTDEYTGKKFFFFEDPDGLPIEIYEK